MRKLRQTPSNRELAHPRLTYGERQSQDLNPRSFGAKLVSFLPHLAQELNEGVDSDGEGGVGASGKSENSSTSLPRYRE